MGYDSGLSGKEPYLHLQAGVKNAISPAISSESPLKTPIVDSVEFARSSEMNISSPVKDDRLDPKKALINFGKGLISPVLTPLQMMMESPKNLILGLSALGGGGLLLKFFGNKLAPFLVAGGLIIGTIQGAMGLNKLLKAKTGNEKEEAFHDFGASTASIGLSWLGIGNLKKLLPGRMNSIAQQESKLSSIGNSVNGAHAVLEPLEKMGQVSAAANIKSTG